MRWRRASPAVVWVKVGVVLVVLDVLLFRVGLFWSARPDFSGGLASVTWQNVWQIARTLETWRPRAGTALIAGSSVVFAGVSDAEVNRALGEAGVPARAVTLSAFGSTCTDSALIVAEALALRPWLVLYGAAARDFRKRAATDTPVTRIFYDSAFDLPALPRVGAEAVLDGWVKRYWQLYRYRPFVRAALRGAAADAGVSLAPAATAAPELPAEALRYFLPYRVTPRSFARWERWRRTGRFADYTRWLRASGGHVLDEYARQTLAAFGPADNPQAGSLAWMLGRVRRDGVRAVLVYFPENPVFRDPAARRWFDPALSDAWAEFFRREAAAHGARFVDLRHLLGGEDFYDLIHPNNAGMRKLSRHIAEIVVEEWRARGAAPAR
jgi:hypothetical protein